MPVQVVPIAEQYIGGFWRCLDAVARERQYLAFVEAPSIESVRSFVRSIIAHGYPQYIALAGRDVVGWSDILPGERQGFAHAGRLGMGVLAGYRRQGIGTRLVQQTIERAWQIELERIELEVYASNRGAIALYEGLGSVREGVKVRARKLDGVYDDILFMALLRSEPAAGSGSEGLQ